MLTKVGSIGAHQDISRLLWIIWLNRVRGANKAARWPPAVLEANLQTYEPLEFWAHISAANGSAGRWKLTLRPTKADRRWASKFGCLERRKNR